MRTSWILFSLIFLCACCSGLCQVSEEYSIGLPQGWKAVWDDESGQHYYWSTVSGETTWVRPWDFDIAELDDPDDLLRGTGIERHDCKILSDDSHPVWPSAAELEAEREASQASDPDAAYKFFVSMDKDGDGGLNEEEFMEALRSQAADPSAWDHEDLTEIKQFFQEKHKKGAAVMSWDEWRMLFSTDEDDSHQQKEAIASQHEQVHGGGDFEDGADLDEEVTYDEVTFRKYDLDGNGVLDKEEVQRMLGRAEALSEVANAADELLAELDLDQDEMVSFSEWISTLY